jgi:hypothetical protein
MSAGLMSQMEALRRSPVPPAVRLRSTELALQQAGSSRSSADRYSGSKGIRQICNVKEEISASYYIAIRSVHRFLLW